MSSVDGPGAGPEGLPQSSELAGEQVPVQLVEALIHVLIEKGVLTKNDALSIVQTVAQVQRGRAVEGERPGAGTNAAIGMLQRMFASFETLAERASPSSAGAENVYQLRPPIYDGSLEFPGDE